MKLKITVGMILLGGMLFAADAPKAETDKPTISAADKLAIRELQLKAERAQRNALDAQKQASEAYAALQTKAQSVAPAGYQITEDAGELALTATPKPEEKKAEDKKK